MIVANKVQQGMAEISKSDFEASIERKVNYMIPFDQKAAANCAKLGQTFIEANRASKAAGVMREIADAIAGAAQDEGASLEGAGKNASLLGKFDIKSLLAKKDKTAGKKKAHAEPAE